MVISDAEQDDEQSEDEERNEQQRDDSVGTEREIRDTDSVASDFEVIPVPECFDMTRPLDHSVHHQENGIVICDLSDSDCHKHPMLMRKYKYI